MGKYSPRSENSDGGLAGRRRTIKPPSNGALTTPTVPPTVRFTPPCVDCGLPLLPKETECPRCVYGAHW